MDTRIETADHEAPEGAITQVLERLREGDASARDELLELVHDQLRRVASAQMGSERRGHTLQATALVNEAFLRLFAGGTPAWNDRRHFLNVAALAMRHVLVDMARERATLRRGGGKRAITFEEWQHALPPGTDLLDLDDALVRLERVSARRARIVELRFFAGLSVAETASVLQLTVRTVSREWQLARLWLFRALDA